LPEIRKIAKETRFEKSILHKYLFLLEGLQLIQKEYPASEKNPLKVKKGPTGCWTNILN